MSSKVELLLERIRKLPPERQEAITAEIDFLLDGEANGSFLTDDEWAQVEPTLDEDREEIPHDELMAELRTKFPG